MAISVAVILWTDIFFSGSQDKHMVDFAKVLFSLAVRLWDVTASSYSFSILLTLFVYFYGFWYIWCSRAVGTNSTTFSAPRGTLYPLATPQACP